MDRKKWWLVPSNDSTFTKQDTIICLQGYFEERKDSIANLSKKSGKAQSDGTVLRRIFFQPWNPNHKSDTLWISWYFEANGFNAGFWANHSIHSRLRKWQNSSEGSTEESEPQIIGYPIHSKGKFKRDAFILDETRTKPVGQPKNRPSRSCRELLIKFHTFLLKKKNQHRGCYFSMDGKTMQFQRSFDGVLLRILMFGCGGRIGAIVLNRKLSYKIWAFSWFQETWDYQKPFSVRFLQLNQPTIKEHVQHAFKTFFVCRTPPCIYPTRKRNWRFW